MSSKERWESSSKKKTKNSYFQCFFFSDFAIAWSFFFLHRNYPPSKLLKHLQCWLLVALVCSIAFSPPPLIFVPDYLTAWDRDKDRGGAMKAMKLLHFVFLLYSPFLSFFPLLFHHTHTHYTHICTHTHTIKKQQQKYMYIAY